MFFFFSSRRRHTRCLSDWSSDVCSSDLPGAFQIRPAFATAQTDPANLKRTRFGDFDLDPALGQALIPRNYGIGPSFFSVNIGISRAIAFGEVPAAANLGPAQPASNKSAAAASAKPEGTKAAQSG